MLVHARLSKKWSRHNPQKWQEFRGKNFAEMSKKPEIVHIPRRSGPRETDRNLPLYRA